MTGLEPLLMDELRREFRRTRPPRRAILQSWSAGIFRITDAQAIGYRIFWFPTSQQERISDFTRDNVTFQLLELLPQ